VLIIRRIFRVAPDTVCPSIRITLCERSNELAHEQASSYLRCRSMFKAAQGFELMNGCVLQSRVSYPVLYVSIWPSKSSVGCSESSR
jgi:hypothetical protein